jgi:large subunit ribosomal protein L18
MADKNIIKNQARLRRKKHIRRVVSGTDTKPRLVVYRSLKHIYAQLVDDEAGNTIAFCSSNSEKAADALNEAKSKIDKSFTIGKILADKAKELNVTEVVFDRGGYLYHGRIKAVAEGARKGGLKF